MSGVSETRSSPNMDVHNEEDESTLHELIKFLKEYFEVEQKSVEVQKFAGDHPIVTIFLIVTVVMCAVPLVIFGMFVFGSIFLAIIGFLFVEGTVLAIGTMILGGVLFFVALLALGVSASIVVGYYSMLMAGDVVNSAQERLPGLQIPAISDVFNRVQEKIPMLGVISERFQERIPALSRGQGKQSEE